MNNILNIKKIHSDFCSWRVADAHVVGGKNTNNGGLRLVPKLNTNKGTNVWLNIKYAMDLYNADNAIVDASYFSSYALFTKESNYPFQQGHHHQLSDMRVNLSLTNANILGIDKTITNNTKQYDLKLKGSLGNGYKEYKSYGGGQIEDKIAKRNWGTEFDQFLAYLKAPETTDMGSPIDPDKPTFEYIFNVRLQSEGNIKTAFQNLFCDKCNDPIVTTKTLSPQGVKVFEAIWGNVGLRGNIWNDIPTIITPVIEAQYRAKFTLLIQNTANTNIYGFIKSR